MKKEKKCPICGKVFIPKRTNQIFCNENNFACRTYNNNEKARKLKEAQGFAPKIIEKNWKVYNTLLKEKNEASFSLDFLKGAGANIYYFTQYKKVDGRGVYMTNNICMENIDNDNFKLYR